MPHATKLTIDALSDIVTGIFRQAGLCDLQARTVAATIVAGERDNCKSHGIYRIAGCLRTIAAGKVDPKSEPELQHDGGPLVRVDAKHGFSPAAFSVGAPVLAAESKTHGIAALVINDCTHFSALWPEVEALTETGVAALAMCPSYASVAPSGGRAPLLGTNPFAFGWPRPGRHPYVFDFATSIVARGEIELHRQDGRPLPDGWAVDAEGRPTTDAEAALAGAMLPFGAHKGSAISTMIELLAGAMIGDLTSPEALDALGSMTLLPAHGELIIAMSPARFAAGRPGDPFARAETLLNAIAEQGARLPSERRFAARDAAMADGIRLSGDEFAMLEELRAG